MGYALITPCRNEQDYMRRTLDSVVAQTVTPGVWVIVDDGSTDDTNAILQEYAGQHDWIKVYTKPDRGHRAVGPGVVEAFYFGLEKIRLADFDYVCKLDLDLDLPPDYFGELIRRMEAEPRLGSCSGKPYFTTDSGRRVPERCGDEMSVGMTKFYRRECFEQIGGFARQVMWDAIDCHKSRQLGWMACSWNDEDLLFEHLRPMGSSQKGILTGRIRHGFGQYYMGTDPFYFLATAIARLSYPPYIIGSAAMIYGYLKAMVGGAKQHEDSELRQFIRRYQRRALVVGKHRAIEEINQRMAAR